MDDVRFQDQEQERAHDLGLDLIQEIIIEEEHALDPDLVVGIDADERIRIKNKKYIVNIMHII